MRKVIVLALILATASVGLASAADKPILGVAEFTNQATGVWWWTRGVGWDLTDMLTNELVGTGAFSVVERAKVEHVLDEQDLAAYGRVEESTAAKVGEMIGAQYLVMGSVSAFEGKTAGTGGGVGYKGIRIGGKKEKAYLAVDLRVVNSTTGQVEFVRTIEGTAQGHGVDVGVYKSGFAGNLGQYENTPVGKAIRACLIHITDYLQCAMVDQDECLQEYGAADKRRRDKTKDSIKID
jgi:curli biogenesis system outer membrane secretion channel CsgG